MGRWGRTWLSEKQKKNLLGRPRAANWLSGGRSAAHQSSCQGFSSPSGVLLHSLIHRVYQAHFFPSHIWLHTWLEGVYPGTCCAEANTCLCLQVRYPWRKRKKLNMGSSDFKGRRDLRFESLEQSEGRGAALVPILSHRAWEQWSERKSRRCQIPN